MEELDGVWSFSWPTWPSLSHSLSLLRMAVSFLTAFSRRALWTILRLQGYVRTPGYSGVDFDRFVLSWAYVFFEYTGMEASKFASAPGRLALRRHFLSLVGHWG